MNESKVTVRRDAHARMPMTHEDETFYATHNLSPVGP